MECEELLGDYDKQWCLCYLLVKYTSGAASLIIFPMTRKYYYKNNHGTFSFQNVRTLNPPDLFWQHSTLLVSPIMYCLNGIPATRFLPRLLQRLLLSSITYKGRGEYGSASHIKVSSLIVFTETCRYLTNFSIISLKCPFLLNNRLWKS
jgi:hypothetical protein